MRVYLAGAIEAAPDDGKVWRRELKPFLEKTLNAEVFDPAIQETDVLSPAERQNFRRWKVTDYSKFTVAIRKIIERDLTQLTTQTDLVICYWDEYVLQGAGTHGELTLAHHFGIPVYLVLGMPLEQVASWILGCADEVFDSFADLQVFLRKPKRSKALRP